MKLQELINRYDPENQYETLKNSSEQIRYVMDLNLDVKKFNKAGIENIVITGLGGSSIGGSFLYDCISDECKIPVIANRNYSLPYFAGSSTLVIASSYSGNTEETLSSIRDAIKKGCQVISITTGGKLKEISEENNIPVVLLKPGYQPRYAFWMSFLTLFKVLDKAGFISCYEEYVTKALELIEKKSEIYANEGSSPWEIAYSLVDKIAVIYSAENGTASVGYRLKAQLNENSKSHAFHNVLPEMNHNEIVGWETYNEKIMKAAVVLIYDEVYHPQNLKRFNILKEILEKKSVKIITLKSSEPEFKLRMFDLIYLVDWISYFLALFNEKDPSEIDFIHYLKKKLA